MKPDKPSTSTPTTASSAPEKPTEVWRVKCEVYFDVPVGGYAEAASAEKYLNDAAAKLVRPEVKNTGHRKVKL